MWMDNRPRQTLLMSLKMLGWSFLILAFASTACEPGYEEMEEREVAREMASHWREPHWFPDGDHIVFSHGRAVYLINSTGSRLEMIEGGGRDLDLAYGPSVSPDGSRIAYAVYKKNWEIVTAKPDGSDQRRLTDNDTHDIGPVWSPDGTRIFCMAKLPNSHYWGISVVSADGSDSPSVPVRVESDPATSSVSGILRLSPSGDRIALAGFASIRGQGRFQDLYVAKADGSDVARLAEQTSMPAWSPDGLRIAFAKREAWDDYTADGVYTIGRDGSDLSEVISFSNEGVPWTNSLTWNGSAILLGSSVIAADGSGVQELPGPRGYASWSPDGSRVGFYTGGRSTALIYTVARDGSDSRVLVELDAEGYMVAAGGRPLTNCEAVVGAQGGPSC